MVESNNISERWRVIINPTSGHGHGLTDFPKIAKLLRL